MNVSSLMRRLPVIAALPPPGVAATRANLRGGAPRRYIRSKPAQFALGHAYTDREAFIDAFVARVRSCNAPTDQLPRR